MKLGPKSILRKLNKEELDIIHLLRALDDKNLFDEISGLELLNFGCTTIVFRKDKNKVLCLSLDYNKVLYLKKANCISSFRFIRFAPFIYDGAEHVVMIYEMEHLRPLEELEDYEESELYSKLLAFDQIEKSEDFLDEVEDILDDIDALIDIRAIYEIQNLKHTQKCQFDLHDGQFLLNSYDQIVCFDPIISSNIST